MGVICPYRILWFKDERPLFSVDARLITATIYIQLRCSLSSVNAPRGRVVGLIQTKLPTFRPSAFSFRKLEASEAGLQPDRQQFRVSASRDQPSGFRYPRN